MRTIDLTQTGTPPQSLKLESLEADGSKKVWPELLRYPNDVICFLMEDVFAPFANNPHDHFSHFPRNGQMLIKSKIDSRSPLLMG